MTEIYAEKSNIDTLLPPITIYWHTPSSTGLNTVDSQAVASGFEYINI